MVIKSRDIKKIRWDDFTAVHRSLKMCIKLFSLSANKFWGDPGLFFPSDGITELVGYQLCVIQ